MHCILCKDIVNQIKHFSNDKGPLSQWLQLGVKADMLGHQIFMGPVFSRVLRDSICHYVCRSVGRSGTT